jgi:hypothetical protein
VRSRNALCGSNILLRLSHSEYDPFSYLLFPLALTDDVWAAKQVHEFQPTNFCRLNVGGWASPPNWALPAFQLSHVVLVATHRLRTVWAIQNLSLSVLVPFRIKYGMLFITISSLRWMSAFHFYVWRPFVDPRRPISIPTSLSSTIIIFLVFESSSKTLL